MSSPDVPASTEYPERVDFFALAEKEPEEVLDLLFPLLGDAELAKKRIQWLKEHAPERPLALVDCNSQLELIVRHGLYYAVHHFGVTVKMLCQMASSKETFLGAYNAYRGKKFDEEFA